MVMKKDHLWTTVRKGIENGISCQFHRFNSRFLTVYVQNLYLIYVHYLNLIYHVTMIHIYIYYLDLAYHVTWYICTLLRHDTMMMVTMYSILLYGAFRPTFLRLIHQCKFIDKLSAEAYLETLYSACIEKFAWRDTTFFV